MDYPKEVLDIAREAVARHPDDIEKSVDVAWDAIAGLDDYETYYDVFIRKAVAELIHQARHMNNRVIRNGGTPKRVPDNMQKVRMWESKSITEVYQGVYTYALNGRMLAQMTGEDLLTAKAREMELRDGHDFNVRLCTELLKKVKATQTVEAVYKASDLERIFKRLRGG